MQIYFITKQCHFYSLNSIYIYSLSIYSIYIIHLKFKLIKGLSQTYIHSFSSQRNQKHQSMKNLPKKPLHKELRQQESQEDQNISLEDEPKQQDNPSFFNKILNKNSLFVTFTGTIESGNIHGCNQLTVYYSIVAGSDWKKVSGSRIGISQVATTNGQKNVWNLPFQISYETTYLSGWPQLVVILYGTDFFGRTIVQGYGNIHLPTDSGLQSRKIRVFKPLPQSIISGIFGYLSGVIAEYKDHEKVLTSGEGREVTRVCTQGQIKIKVETTKHNFKKFGYQ